MNMNRLMHSMLMEDERIDRERAKAKKEGVYVHLVNQYFDKAKNRPDQKMIDRGNYLLKHGTIDELKKGVKTVHIRDLNIMLREKLKELKNAELDILEGE